MKQSDLDAQLSEAMADFYADPLGHVMFSYPWDSDASIQVVDWENEDLFVNPRTGYVYEEWKKGYVTYKRWMLKYRRRYKTRFGPDRWACEFLDQVGEEVRKRGFDGRISVKPIQFSTSSGHGIGKTTLVAWLIKWIMDTRPYARGTVTANTAEQLRSKTWAELGKWHSRSLTNHWFKYNSGRGNMSLRRIGKEEEWYCVAQTCREENSEAFAGQHAATSTSFYIFDEASAVPGKIYEVREGGTTDGEPMTFDFGNPTRNSGKFYDQCEGGLRDRYVVRHIDSRCVAITNKHRIAQWEEDYGEDSDFMRVRVKGQFPNASSMQFIGADIVRRAMVREPVTDRFAPLTIGVDVARFGDDLSVIWPMVGNDARSFHPTMRDGIYSGLDNIQLAEKVIAKILFLQSLGLDVMGVLVDVTGTGSGVYDMLVHSGFEEIVFAVNFGTSPVFEPNLYRYRSDEIWGRGRDKITSSWVLPRTKELGAKTREEAELGNRLLNDLTQREYGFTLQGEKTHLESKKDMKARGLSSPDVGEGLLLNSAMDFAPSKLPHGAQQSGGLITGDFDPMNQAQVA